MTRTRKIKLAYPLILLFFICGCSGEQFQFEQFTYPPNMPAHENNWLLKGEMRVSTNEAGSMYRKGKKKVVLKIINKNNDILLDKKLEYVSSDIKGEFIWKGKDELTITLTEYGHASIQDEYNNNLLKIGGQKLAVLEFKANPNTEQFELKNQ